MGRGVGAGRAGCDVLDAILHGNDVFWALFVQILCFRREN